MKSTTLFSRMFFMLLFGIVILTKSCKKVDLIQPEDIPKSGTRSQLTIDSIYLYAHEIYLWNDALPNYSDFNPRERYKNLNPEVNALKQELFDISQFKINEKTGLPYEYANGYSPKYSFIREYFGEMVKYKATTSESYKNNMIISHIDNVSYLAIHSFPVLKDIKSTLDHVFSEIASHMTKTLVIDLRYNEGGYIETVEYLANLVGPSRLNGKKMYSEIFNETLKTNNAKILKNQPYLDENGKYVMINNRQATLADVDYSEKGNTYYFNKKGTLNSIDTVYFITSQNTASASELLISILKPYLNTKLVGERTFGKPVGFFPINIDKYEVYLASFLIVNANGWSDYFSGIEPDISVDIKETSKLGEREEACLKIILEDANKVPYRSKLKMTGNERSLNLSRHERNIYRMSDPMIESRLKLKTDNF